MAAIYQLRCSSPLSSNFSKKNPQVPSPSPIIFRTFYSSPASSQLNFSKLSLIQTRASNPSIPANFDVIDSGNGNNGGKGKGTGGDGDDSSSDSSSDGNDHSSSPLGFGILGLFIEGWKSRVSADPQFPFKVLMEELVGVSACVLGDMSSRPNFGLNELDFVFSTLVVGSILNFVLMYLLAPTMSSNSSSLPSIFASCPQSHMFEPGAFSVVNRMGTFVYKGAVFAAVGFAAGLVGTAISNGLIVVRKKMDPNFETPNKAPPTLLNAMTWATHMGLSSNFRYQTLNGVEYVLAKGLPPLVFKGTVVVLRCLNNVLGGVSFVTLARLTGSQKVDSVKANLIVEDPSSLGEKEKLVDRKEDYKSTSQSTDSK
ncbi:hypothetical protein GIB67_022804 [Kingdonia uniflora]|uniref:Uncharacterized protein n=1 Tax=Kingdonia uniflora TaxID=39325 RepID=A0A7J7P721_9MAGN|nr:hypothetical protein GIB67_022804 [Kingdonia uniflora]